MKKTDIFRGIVPCEKMHESFRAIKSLPTHSGARKLINEIYNKLPNPGKNFVDQFQTQGFEARSFEIGLYAFLDECALDITQDHSRPDFIVSNGNTEVCIEAVTSNPADHLKLINIIKNYKELNQYEIEEKIRNELPRKFGGPLYDKMKKKYWELSQCKDKPLLFAIQMAHEPMSALYTATSIVNYCYGIESYFDYSKDGVIIEKVRQIDVHIHEDKTIPSNFFSQQNTENVSGILFSNQLTMSKFIRMAYQKGYGPDDLEFVREGFHINQTTGYLEPYSYESESENVIEETWTQGLTLILNPNAKNQIPQSYFPKLATVSCHGSKVSPPCIYDFHPLISVSRFSYSG